MIAPTGYPTTAMVQGRSSEEARGSGRVDGDGPAKSIGSETRTAREEALAFVAQNPVALPDGPVKI
jgi:hypothetical protein